MKNRTVAQLLYAETVDMGGMPVRQPFPTMNTDQIDPFLLLHHHKAKIPEAAVPAKSGVGPHPHRGFSPVTFVYKGGVHHRDSRGNNSVVYEGGTQWLNAGMGIIHSERPPQDIQERGGVQEIIQLWINTPKAHKMDQPKYIALQANETPTFRAQDDKLKVQVISGEFESIKGPVVAASPVLALRLELKKDASYNFPVPADYNAFLYLLSGQIKLANFGLVDELHLVKFNNDGEGCSITAMQDTNAILMAGLPLQEPVAQHGPFVMNTQTEVMQAMRDYQQGKMGVLIED